MEYKDVHAAIMAGPNAELQGWIDSGTAWMLEGAVGRAASAALESGACVLGPEVRKDYWGNTVPAYYMVADGTKGSVALAEAYLEESE